MRQNQGTYLFNSYILYIIYTFTFTILFISERARIRFVGEICYESTYTYKHTETRPERAMEICGNKSDIKYYYINYIIV